MQPLATLAELPVAQWGPGPHGPGPHGPHWGGGPMAPSGTSMGGVGLGFGGWWLLLLLLLLLLVALLVVGVVAAALYLQAREGQRTTEDGARERYAAGDPDREEFERRYDRLTGGAS